MSALRLPSRIAFAVVLVLGVLVGTGGVVAVESGDGDSADGLVDDAVNETEETTDSTIDTVESTADGTTDTVESATEGTTDDVESTTATTTDTVESTTDATTDTVEETTDDTTDTVESPTDGTSDSVESTTGGTTDGVESATDGTMDTVESTTDDTTDAVEATADDAPSVLNTSVEGSTGLVDETVNETSNAVDETVDGTTGTVDDTVDTTSGTIDDLRDHFPELASHVDDESGGGFDDSGADSGAQQSGVDVAAGPESPLDDDDANFSANEDDGPTDERSETDDATGEQTSGPGGDVANVSSWILVIVVQSTPAAATTSIGVAASGLTVRINGLPARNFARTGSRRPWDYVGSIFRYSRYDDSDPLEHDGRRSIYETIDESAGVNLSELAELHDTPLSTARHHLRILEAEDLVETEKIRGKRWYFPTDATDAVLIAALSDPATRRLLEALATLGPALNVELASELDRDPSTISHHLKTLESEGLVEREREGRAVVNRIAQTTRRGLSHDGVSIGGESD